MVTMMNIESVRSQSLQSGSRIFITFFNSLRIPLIVMSGVSVPQNSEQGHGRRPVSTATCVSLVLFFVVFNVNNS